MSDWLLAFAAAALVTGVIVWSVFVAVLLWG